MLLAHYENNIIPYELNHSKILNDWLKAFFRYLESFQGEQTRRHLPFFRYVIEVSSLMAQKPGACVQTCQVNVDDEKERLSAEELPALHSIPDIRHTPADSVMLSVDPWVWRQGLHYLFGSFLFLRKAARVSSIVQHAPVSLVSLTL